MQTIYQSHATPVVIITLVALALFLTVHGYRRFGSGVAWSGGEPRPLWVVQGIRAWITAIALGSIAAGLYYAVMWPILFGLVFLGEELLETGVMILALRQQEKSSSSN